MLAPSASRISTDFIRKIWEVPSYDRVVLQEGCSEMDFMAGGLTDVDSDTVLQSVMLHYYDKGGLDSRLQSILLFSPKARGIS